MRYISTYESAYVYISHRDSLMYKHGMNRYHYNGMLCHYTTDTFMIPWNIACHVKIRACKFHEHLD